MHNAQIDGRGVVADISPARASLPHPLLLILIGGCIGAEEGSHERTRLSPILCYTGKIQGISLALASVTRIWCLNPHYNQRLTSKFPTQRNRELNGPYQGIKSA